MTYILIVIFGLAGLLIPYFAAPWMNKRSLSQPISAATDEEKNVIASIKAQPKRLPWFLEIKPEFFVYTEHQKIWELYLETYKELGGKNFTDGAANLELKAAGEALDETQFLNLLKDKLQEDNVNLYTYFTNLSTIEWEYEIDYNTENPDPAVLAASDVYATGFDRTTYLGAAEVTVTENLDVDDPTVVALKRSVFPGWKKRRIWFSILTGIASAMVPWLLSSVGYTDFGLLFGSLSLVTLLLTSGVIAWVDFDTLLVDLPVWWTGSGLSFLFAAAAAVFTGVASNILVGVACAILVAVFIELINFMYRKIRKAEGQGFGDTLILLGTIGVPVTVTGSFLTAYLIVMASLLLALLVWVVKAVAGKAGKQTPIAFGPWLAMGWFFGLLAWVAI